MARYIDADKVIEEARLSYCKDCNSYNGVRCSACGFDDAMTYIEDTPTADVVEVVKCKDCKHSNEDGTICRYSVGRSVEPDHFCSYGTPKESEK